MAIKNLSKKEFLKSMCGESDIEDLLEEVTETYQRKKVLGFEEIDNTLYKRIFNIACNLMPSKVNSEKMMAIMKWDYLERKGAFRDIEEEKLLASLKDLEKAERIKVGENNSFIVPSCYAGNSRYGNN